jgi:hypothetical protein
LFAVGQRVGRRLVAWIYQSSRSQPRRVATCRLGGGFPEGVAISGRCRTPITPLVCPSRFYKTADPDCQDIDLTLLTSPEAQAVVVELEVRRLSVDPNVSAYFDDIELVELPEPGALASAAAIVALTGLDRHRSATRAAHAAATRG